MSIETLQTLAEQYRAQIEALQKENAKLETRNDYLETRNAYLENELKQAKDLFQDIVNDWEVANFEEVKPNVLDDMFQNPLQQLNNLF